MRALYSSMTMTSMLLLWLLLAVTAPPVVQATITIMEAGSGGTGKVFPSRPEKKLGHQLWKGSEYMGRLQFVHGNLQLCKSAQDPQRRFTITETMDGLPVAIYAKAGGCSLEEKALVASTLLDPPNIVGYLIVDDDGRGRKKKKKKTPSFFSFWGQSDEEEEDDLFDDFVDNPFWAEVTAETDEDLGSLWEELMAQVQTQPRIPFEMRTLAPLQMDIDADDDHDEQVETLFMVEHLVTDDETAPPMLLEELGEDVLDGLSNTDDLSDSSDSSSDDEMVALPKLPLERFRVQKDENAWWPGGDEIQSDDGGNQEHYYVSGHGGRRLKHHHDDSDQINVAILHVSNRVGFDLLDILLKESSEVGRLGGPKLLLNSKEPNATARTILIWTMLSIAICASACCCLLACVEFLGEEEANTPQQPVRRRLNHAQVRENFPAFLYHPENHVEQPLDDECAICLDDFTEGMRLRKLPCGHVFHSTCISRWLIERSAVCPLCKVDLYEDEEEEEEEATEAAGADGTLQSLTSWLSRRSNNDQPATAAASRWSWWGTATTTPGSPVGAENQATGATAPTAPPARAFRWGFTVAPTTAPAEDEGVQDGGAIMTTTTTTSPLAAVWLSPRRWFAARTNRRRTRVGGDGMSTELTEPLIAGAASSEATSPTASAPIEEEATETAAAQDSVSSGYSAPASTPVDQTVGDPESSSPSSPVEV